MGRDVFFDVKLSTGWVTRVATDETQFEPEFMGKTYYYNTETEQTNWEKMLFVIPRGERKNKCYCGKYVYNNQHRMHADYENVRFEPVYEYVHRLNWKWDCGGNEWGIQKKLPSGWKKVVAKHDDDIHQRYKKGDTVYQYYNHQGLQTKIPERPWEIVKKSSQQRQNQMHALRDAKRAAEYDAKARRSTAITKRISL